jgi:myo-inositol-1(or 4)-monophosphatase
MAVGDRPAGRHPQLPDRGRSLVGVHRTAGGAPETKQRVGALVAGVLPGIGDLRRVPAALALSYVAAGRFDAAMLIDTKLWDVAAGLLIAAEAGAALHDESFRGAAVIVATAPGLWPELWKLVPAVR